MTKLMPSFVHQNKICWIPPLAVGHGSRLRADSLQLGYYEVAKAPLWPSLWKEGALSQVWLFMQAKGAAASCIGATAQVTPFLCPSENSEKDA
mmetsp:Transcript_1091/g.2735  ORF Transcript_1091/g.2735 Transcript_1091/m.2735 type:complete len:93 (-) Transcript_1091:2072-2350(-)